MNTPQPSTRRPLNKKTGIIIAIISLLVLGLAAFVVPAAISTRNSIGIDLEGFRNSGSYRTRGGDSITVDAGNAREYTLKGEVLRSNGINSVTVNNVPATVSGNSFEATVQLKNGSNSIQVEATSGDKKATRFVSITSSAPTN